jgi:hypothetical protein
MKLQRANYRPNDLIRLAFSPPADHPPLRFGERCQLIGGSPDVVGSLRGRFRGARK